MNRKMMMTSFSKFNWYVSVLAVSFNIGVLDGLVSKAQRDKRVEPSINFQAQIVL